MLLTQQSISITEFILQLMCLKHKLAMTSDRWLSTSTQTLQEMMV